MSVSADISNSVSKRPRTSHHIHSGQSRRVSGSRRSIAGLPSDRPSAHVGPGRGRAGCGGRLAPPTRERPDVANVGRQAGRVPAGRYLRMVNWPRSVFTNRASAPLSLISRRMALYSVACGVLPPGLVHSPLAAIRSIIALVLTRGPQTTRPPRRRPGSASRRMGVVECSEWRAS